MNKHITVSLGINEFFESTGPVKLVKDILTTSIKTFIGSDFEGFLTYIEAAEVYPEDVTILPFDEESVLLNVVCCE